jgi:polyhydroxybutyrate depolymerase
MKPRRFFFAAVLLVAAFVGSSRPLSAAESLAPRDWTVDGVKREGLVHVPSGPRTPPAVVFAFHGHGGNMRQAARSFAFHVLWPEAVVVYLQGLNTPGRLTDPEGKRPGWQHGPGDQGDRDLKFFDVVLAELRREFQIDDRRVFATGHSNGGAFTYLLWARRGDVLAAVAPSGAAAPDLVGKLRPKPALHVAGVKDPLVKFAWQQATMAAVLKLNRCDAGRAWEHGGVWHDSQVNSPVVIWTHPGGHEFPPAARPAIVAFFQGTARR